MQAGLLVCFTWLTPIDKSQGAGVGADRTPNHTIYCQASERLRNLEPGGNLRPDVDCFAMVTGANPEVAPEEEEVKQAENPRGFPACFCVQGSWSFKLSRHGSLGEVALRCLRQVETLEERP